MSEFWLGWITKGRFNISILDMTIACVEIFLSIFIIYLIIVVIEKIRDKRKNKK